MRRLAVTLGIIGLVISIFALPAPLKADSSLEVIFEDTMWGMGIGTLLGAATLAFTNDPGDHYDRLVQGASIGVICGTCFGFYEVSPMFYSVRDPASGNRTYVLGVNFQLK